METARQTAVADQFEAASTDAMSRIAALIARQDTLVVPGAGIWVADQLAALTAALRARKVRCCPHAATAPGVVYAAAWARWTLACTRCIRLLTPAPDEESLCDRCRDRSGALYEGVAAAGPLILLFALCPPCIKPSTGRVS